MPGMLVGARTVFDKSFAALQAAEARVKEAEDRLKILCSRMKMVRRCLAVMQ